MSEIKDIIQSIDIDLLHKKYEETKGIMNMVGKFIIQKKLLLYGGLALNLMLPKKHKFYKSFTINDYDCFSKDAKKDAIELAKQLGTKKYKYIKIRKALHDNTYKIYVNFIKVLDITQITPKLYDKCLQIFEEERKTVLYKYYNDKYTLMPFLYLISNMHYELARPLRSYFRWEKIYTRLNTIISVFTNKIRIRRKTKSLESKFPTALMKYIKNNQLPIVNEYALRYHDTDEYRDSSTIMILTMKLENTKKDIAKLLGDNIEITYDNEYPEVMHENYTIYLPEKNLYVKIVSVQDDCFSCTSKKGYLVGSYDTILYFVYRQYILSQLHDNPDMTLWHLILSLEKKLLKIKVDKRLIKTCYGSDFSLTDILKNKWKKKQTLLYV